MLISKMYRLEKLVQQYKSDDIVNNWEEALNICKRANIRLSSVEKNYLARAIAMPYTEMLEHINYYRNNMMDEVDTAFFIGDLSKQYNLPPCLIIERFHNVEHLANSLIYKKRIGDLYFSEDSQVKKILK